jgi:hypothetical protein
VVFAPGDRVFLRGGDTFTGTVYLNVADRGSPTNPVVITSYGIGRATISSGSGDGVHAYNTAGFKISNINFIGESWSTSSGSGIYFYMDLPDATLDTITIDSVTVSDFKNGIEIGAWKEDSGFRNVTIARSITRDNRENGITVWGDSSPRNIGYSHHNVRIVYCRSYHNSGPYAAGNGIVISNVDNGIIERSLSYNNGMRNKTRAGPVGIWAWRSNNIIIQHNESYRNHSTEGGDDGNGFSLDGGVTNSVMQYNYAHENDGAGFVLAQYDGALKFYNNTIRYNVTENDGRRNFYAGIYVWSAQDYGITSSRVYNNTIYISPSPSGVPVGVAVVSKTQQLSIQNNIIVTRGGLTLLHMDPPQSRIAVQGNAYWSSGNCFRVKWEGTYYNNLRDFRSTGQEQLDGKSTGYFGDPQLVAPGAGGTIGNPRKIEHLSAYKLDSTSPLIERGLNLSTLFGEKVGRQDYYGTLVPSGVKFDVGAYEKGGR